MSRMADYEIELMETAAWEHTDKILKSIELWHPIMHRRLTARLVWEIVLDGYNYEEDDWTVQIEINDYSVSVNGVETGETYGTDHRLSVSGDLIREWQPADIIKYLDDKKAIAAYMAEI